MEDPKRKIFRRFLQPFSRSKLTAVAATNLLMLLQESTWHVACSNVQLHLAMHSWFPVETNICVMETVSDFFFFAAQYMLHTRSMSSRTLLLLFLERKRKGCFSPFCLWVKAIACRLVCGLILLSRISSSKFINIRRLVLTFVRDTSVPFDKIQHSSLPDFEVALFFTLLILILALALGKPIFLRSGCLSLCDTSLSDF